MSSKESKEAVLATLDTLDTACRALARLPFERLSPAEQRALLVRFDEVGKEVASLQRRMLARMVSGPPPREFAGAPWADVLARRLRISPAEAQRLVTEARQGPEPMTA
jgi:hypothetical protein